MTDDTARPAVTVTAATRIRVRTRSVSAREAVWAEARPRRSALDAAPSAGQTFLPTMTTGVLPHRRYTIHEYVQLEGYSNVRHEYFGDQIFAMAGGSPEHGTRAANIIGLLAARLRGRPCRVQTSDVRIRVVATGLDTYPDVSVVCGRAELDKDDPQAITNPTILFEVLSPSTEEYDRGEKLEHYKRVPALREVVFVAHDRKRVDVVRRLVSQSQPVVGTWVATTAGIGESVRLESLDCDLPVDEIYRDPLAAD